MSQCSFQTTQSTKGSQGGYTFLESFSARLVAESKQETPQSTTGKKPSAATLSGASREYGGLISDPERTFCTDLLNTTGHQIWKWKDIDGRKLTFGNNDRPARRPLYSRYALAYMISKDKNRPGYRTIPQRLRRSFTVYATKLLL